MTMTTMGMDQVLSNFFSHYVHETDSKLVGQEFSKNITPNFNWSSNVELTTTNNSILFHLLYIARLHGLPLDFFPHLVDGVKKDFSLKFKLQIATVLKYCVTLNDQFRFPFSDLTNLLHVLQLDINPSPQASNDHNNDEVTTTEATSHHGENNFCGEMEQEILSQMMLTTAHLVSPENYGEFMESKLLDSYFSHLTDPMVRAEVYKSIENCRRLALAASPTAAGSADQKLFREELDYFQNNNFSHLNKNNNPQNGPSMSRRSDDVFKMTATITTTTTTNLRQGGRRGVKTDFVRVQQTNAMTCQRQSGSERVEFELTNLATALGHYRQSMSSKAKNSREQYGFEDKVKKSQAGSDRSSWRFTTSNIDFLLIKSSNGSVIREEDIIWLKDCIINDSIFRQSLNFLVSLYPEYRGNVAKIFGSMARHQIVSLTVLEEIASYLFSNVLDPSWNDCRNEMLKAFYGFSSRISLGRLENILINFQKNKQLFASTPQMDRWIWRIIQDTDKNLSEVFQEAVDILNQDISPPPKIPYDPSTYEEFIAYVAKQVGTAHGCRPLEENEGTKFFHKFVSIVTNHLEYAPRTRVLILEIVEDTLALAHNFSVELKVFLNPQEILCLITAHQEVTQILKDNEKKSSDNYYDPSKASEEERILRAWKWENLDSQVYQKSIISCIIRTLQRPEGLEQFLVDDNFRSKLGGKVLEFLLKISIRDKKQERELEALAVVCLGGILRREPSIMIPSVYSLYYKLLRRDFVDSEGQVYLQNQGGDEEEEEAVGSKNNFHYKKFHEKNEEEEEDSTFISAIVAQMFLVTFKRFYDQKSPACPPEFVLESIAQAASGSPDKLTKILSSEALLTLTKTVNFKPFGQNEIILSCLREGTMDRVWDVQVMSKMVYVTVLEKVSISHQLIPNQHLEHLLKIYAHDPLTLQGQDYTNNVNDPILTIFHGQAGVLGSLFSTDIFNFFATIILNANSYDDDDEEHEGSGYGSIDRILDTIGIYVGRSDVEARVTKVPQLCVEAVENLFLSQSNNNQNSFSRTMRVLNLICEKLGQRLSHNVVEQLYNNLLHDEDALCVKSRESLFLLTRVNIVQELPLKFFDRLDMELMAVRIFSLLLKNYYEFHNVDAAHPFFLLNGSKDLQERETARRLYALAKKLFGADFSQKKVTHLEKIVGQLLDRIQRNVKEGQKLTPLHFKNFHVLLYLKFDLKKDNVLLQCLTQAAQNGQRLSTEVMEAVYDSSNENEGSLEGGQIKNWRITLALALIQNNQLLPHKFVKATVQKFEHFDPLQVDRWGMENLEILDMITKFVQHNQLPSPMNVFVGQKFVQCLLNCGQQITTSGSSSSIVELKLKFLSALLPLIGQVQEFFIKKRDKAKERNADLKFVFLKAMESKNSEILKLGLKGFLSLNWDIMNGLGEGPKLDLQILLNIQTERSLTSRMKEQIKNFISTIHTNGQTEKALAMCEDEKDTIFLDGMDQLYDLGGSPDYLNDLQGRLQRILEEKKYSQLQLTALTHISKWAEINYAIPGETLEKVVVCFENHKKETPKVTQLCQQILDKALDHGGVSTEVKERLLKFLKNDAELFLNQLLKMAQDPELSQSEDLRFMLQIRKSLLEPNEVERNRQIFNYFQKSTTSIQVPISLDETTFINLLSMDNQSFELLASPQFANFVAENFLEFGLDPVAPKGHGKCLENAILVLQNAVVNHGRHWENGHHFLSESIFLAYREMISQFWKNMTPQHVTTCLDCMIQIFDSSTPKKDQNESEKIREAIFWCILEIISVHHEGDSTSSSFKIPHTVLPILTKFFDNPTTPYVRRKAFEGLRILQKNDPLMHQPVDKILDAIRPLILPIFKKIYGPDQGKFEMDQDSEFGMDVLGMILGSNFFPGDFTHLSKTMRGSRTAWRRHFLFMDAIKTFAVTEDEKLELHLLLSKLIEKLDQDWVKNGRSQLQKPDDVIEILIHRFTQQQVDPSCSEVLATLKCAIELTPGQLLKICQYSKKSHNWQRTIEEHALVSILKPKISFLSTRDQKGLSQVIKKFVQSVAGRVDFGRIFCKSLKEIENLQQLDDLVSIFVGREENIGKISLKLGHPNSLTDPEPTLLIKDVKVTLQIQLLMAYLPSRGVEASQLKKRSRAESQLRHILGNHKISIEQLSKFWQILQEKRQRTGENQNIVESIFLYTISQIFYYKLGPQSLQNLMDKLNQNGSSQSIQEIFMVVAGHVNSEIFGGDQAPETRNTDAIMEELKIGNVEADLDWEKIKNNLIRIKMSDVVSRIHKIVKDGKLTKIADWDLPTVIEWADIVKKMGQTNHQNSEFYIEAIMVAKRALLLVANFQLTDIQILACLLALNVDMRRRQNTTGQKLETGNGQKGLLQQVGTGSGKSTIVAIIAVIKSLQGFPVDIYTSNHILAERDAKEWRKFYQVFGITCDHNRDKCSGYTRGPKFCYRQAIVYGECAQFQFDHLRDSYSDLGTLAGRGLKVNYAIVDEVDSMFIDDSSKLARLSSTIPGTDCLQLIFHLGWERLCLIKSRIFSISRKIYYLDGKIEIKAQNGGRISYSFGDESPGTREILKIFDVLDYIVTHSDKDLNNVGIKRVTNLEDFVSKHLNQYLLALVEGEKRKKIETIKVPQKTLQNKQSASNPTKLILDSIKIPGHLKKFVLGQIPKWVNSALTSLTFQMNQHYIVEEGQIKPVDFQTTGVIQSSTNWNDGLHQFLQIKHSLKLTAETVTTNFLSNMAIFSKYKGGNLVGFTGTLGSVAGRNFMSRQHQVDHLVMPETHFKKYFRLPNALEQDETSWLHEIVQQTLEETVKGRGVLIICESIGKAELIEGALRELGGRSEIKLKIYTKNRQHQEKEIERVRPGDVIVATNLAGRGTDIKTVDIEKWGGLHVILTFLPETSRVEDQAFGRTARLGHRGTGGVVIVHSKGVGGSGSGGPNFESDWTQQLAEDRDAREKLSLENFQKTELPLILMKDLLFAKFSTVYNGMRGKLRRSKSIFQTAIQLPAHLIRIGEEKSKRKLFDDLPFDQLVILQAVEERWAMFLRKVDDGQIPFKSAAEEYNKFEAKISKQFEQKTVLQGDGDGEGEEEGGNPFYFIQLGNYAYTQKGRGCGEEAEKYFQKAIHQDPHFSAPAKVGKAFLLLRKGDKNKGANKNESKNYYYKHKAINLLTQALALLHEEMGMLNCQHLLVTKRDGGGVESDLFGQISAKINILGSYISSVERVVETVGKSLRKIEIESTNFHTRQRWTIQNPSLPLEKTENFDNYSLHFHDLTVQGSSDQALATIDKAMEEGPFPKISFQCPDANLETLGMTQEILNKIHAIDIELFNLNVETVLGILTHPENGQPASFSVEVVMTTHKSILYQLAMTRRAEGGKNGGKFFDAEIIMMKKGEENSTAEFSTLKTCHLPPQLVSEEGRKVKINSFIHHHDDNGNGEDLILSIKFINLASGDEGQVCDKIGQILNPLLHLSSAVLNLSLFSLQEKTTILDSWGTVFSEFSQNFVTLHAVGVGWGESVKNILKILQNPHTTTTPPFILQLTKIPSKVKVLSILQNSQAHQEHLYQSALKLLCDLYPQEHTPVTELREFSSRGIELVVSFNEKNFVPWHSVMTMGTVAALEAASGGLLLMTSFGSTVGMNLLVESLSDVQMTYHTYSTRSQVDWSKYRWKKATNLLMSASSIGLESLVGRINGVRTLVASSEAAGFLPGFLPGVQATGKSVQSVILKQVTAFGKAQGSRAAMKTLTSTLSNFTFERIRTVILDEVLVRIEAKFDDKGETKLRSLLSKNYALDKYRGSNLLVMKIEKILEATASSNTKNSWTLLWDQVGLKLCKDIFSLPKYAASTFTLISRAAVAIKDARELKTIVDKVCAEILLQVDTENMSVPYILTRLCKIGPDRAKILTPIIERHLSGTPGFGFKNFPPQSNFNSTDEYKGVKNCFEKLQKYYIQFGVKNVDIGQIIFDMAQRITNQIVKSGNAQLANPRNSFAVTRLHTNLEEAGGDSRGKNEEKKYFVQLPPQKSRSSPNVDMKKAESVDRQVELIHVRKRLEDRGCLISDDLYDLAVEVVKSKFPEFPEMFIMAKSNGVNLKIVKAPCPPNNSEVTGFGLDGIFWVIYFEERGGDQRHYQLVNGGPPASAEEFNDSGYAIMSRLTGKSIAILRMETAENILNSPPLSQIIFESAGWVAENCRGESKHANVLENFMEHEE